MVIAWTIDGQSMEVHTEKKDNYIIGMIAVHDHDRALHGSRVYQQIPASGRLTQLVRSELRAASCEIQLLG